MATRVTQDVKLVAALPPQDQADTRVTQVVKLIVSTWTATDISIYPAAFTVSATFPAPTVTVVPPAISNPDLGGSSGLPPPLVIFEGPEYVYVEGEGEGGSTPAPSPSTPPVLSGPGGGEGVGGSGIGVGVGIGGGVGPIVSPAEVPVATMPVDPLFIPKVTDQQTVPPYQIIPRSAIPPEYNRVPMPPAIQPNAQDRALAAQGEVWERFLAGPRGRATLDLNRGLEGLQGPGMGRGEGRGMAGLGTMASDVQQVRSLDTYRRGSRGLEREFFERGNIITPGPGPDVVVVDWEIPVGYVARIYAYYCIYTGTGFVQGSGDIVWGLRVGWPWARNMGGLLFAMGALANPFPVGDYIQARAGERVQFVVNVPNISGLIQVGLSRILCGVQGWLFPMTKR
jgi:hypothetical protein